MEILLKIAAIAVIGVVIALLLKKNNPPLGLVLTITLALAAVFLAIDSVQSVIDFLKELANTAQISPAVLTIVLKTLGISFITKLAADICIDAEQKSIATGIEFVGAFASLYIALPLFKTVITMINSLA